MEKVKPAKKEKTSKKEVEANAEMNTEVSPAEALRLKMEAEFDAVYKTLEDPKYVNQGYKKGVTVEISGELFTHFVNVNAENKRVMDAVQKNLSVAFSTIDALLTQNASLSIELMKAHIKNIDEGKTTDNDKLLSEENASN